MSNIEKLQPADKAAVGVYLPYYQGAKRTMLPLAISLYQQGSLEGHRRIEGGGLRIRPGGSRCAWRRG